MARRLDMHWSDVKASLEKAGSSLAAVALSLGISRVSMTKVSWRPNARAQATIAKVLKVNPQAIWPTRYSIVSGTAIRPSTWMGKNSRPKRPAHGKNRKTDGHEYYKNKDR